jgi:hypothetical protein
MQQTWRMESRCPTYCRCLLLGLAITCLLPLPGAVAEDTPVPSRAREIDPQAFPAWQAEQRRRLREMLGIPAGRVPLEAEKRGQVEWDGIVIERWVFTSEPSSRVPAVLYRPAKPPARMPAVVLTFGHGGSKSQWQYNYARLGLACLAMDPIGEEERHRDGRLGTRAHDPKPVSDRADRAGRLIMGKLVFDTMRGIDFLLERDDVDPERVGVVGNSLGGAKAGWMPPSSRGSRWRSSRAGPTTTSRCNRSSARSSPTSACASS